MAKNYSFTLNNYTDVDEENLKTFEEFNYIIYGHEVAPTTGTKHLQGYFQLKVKKRLTYLIKKLPKGIHLEISRGSLEQNKTYCGKDENNIIEIGIPTIAGSNTSKLYKEIMECKTWGEVLKLNGIERRLNYAREVWNTKPVPIMENVKLRKWQERLLKKLQKPADDRTIYIVVDKEGGKGKTFLCKYLVANHNAFYFSPSKNADVVYAYANQEIILYDIPRCTDDMYINWGTIEKLKDGIYFSGKYNSGTRYRNTNAHIVIFTNNEIPDDKFSKDRLHYLKI